MMITTHAQLIENDWKTVSCTIDWIDTKGKILVKNWKVFILNNVWEHIAIPNNEYEYSLLISEDNMKYETSQTWVFNITL